jgi:hypothetical protein
MIDPVSACPTDTALGSFYAGELEAHEDEAIRDHLVGCAACRERAADAAAFAEAMRDDARLVTRGRRIGGVPVWAAAMAAVFAAAVILVLWRTVTLPRPPVSQVSDARTRWDRLAVDPAPYDPNGEHGIVWRGGEQAPDADASGSFAWAMAPYDARDFAGAADRLGQRLRTDPGDERARFYLGVSLLLTGHPDQSVDPLRRVVEESDLLSSNASWYLAVACLKTGDVDRATALLRDLAAQEGNRGARARQLLGEIEGQPKR